MMHTGADKWASGAHITVSKAKNNGVGHSLASSLGRVVKHTKLKAGK